MPGAREPLAASGDLTARVRDLEKRVAELEAVVLARRAAPAEPAEEVATVAPALPAGTVGLVGRTLLVLAGAYLVRALTDSHTIPVPLGVAVALVYAAFWQLRADREALQGLRQSAGFHDLASSLIAFPLIWETAARFGMLSPRSAFAALVAFFVLGIGVAVHRRLAFNAAATTALALATAVALLVSTHDLLPALLALLAVAAALEWVAFHDRWLGLRWCAAGVLDAVAVLTVLVRSRPRLPEGYAPVSDGAASLALLAVPALYILSVAARTLRHGRKVTAFEVVQGSLSVLIGIGGAFRVLTAHGERTLAPGAIAVLLGALCYAAAFAFAERRPGQGRNFYFYSTAGGLLLLGGTGVLGLGSGLDLVWIVLGLAAALLGRRFGRMTLRAHSAVYLAAAALQTGLVAACARALAGGPTGSMPPTAWLAAAGAAVGWGLLASDPGMPRSGLARVPPMLLALLAVVAVGKAAQLGLFHVLGSPVEADEGVRAVARTAVLAALALGLALGARRGKYPELGWLVYPLVLLGGLKLLLQDLPAGRPATLVISLALYGAVLVLAPRLLRGAPRPPG